MQSVVQRAYRSVPQRSIAKRAVTLVFLCCSTNFAAIQAEQAQQAASNSAAVTSSFRLETSTISTATTTTTTMASTTTNDPSASTTTPTPHAIIVGTGLAGMTAALTILDRQGTVVLLEKEHGLGGNSNKASSGINRVSPQVGDSPETFRDDTLQSAGAGAQPALVETLVQHSEAAVEWLRTRLQADLSESTILGGHSVPRTYRPETKPVGFELVSCLKKAIQEYVVAGKAQLITDARVTRLLRSDDASQSQAVVGVEYEIKNPNDATTTTTVQLHAPHVVLATGGYASDRSAGSLLAQHRPELLTLPTTAGPFSTGDGVTLALDLGAATVDLDQVQVHPTGFVDPADPSNPTKFLAAELLRGAGGILLYSQTGQRFCNELGNRAYVVEQMKKVSSSGSEPSSFALIMSSAAAQSVQSHVDFYVFKKLMQKLSGITALAEWMKFDVNVLRATLQEYQKHAQDGTDPWGRTSFQGLFGADLDQEVFYAGMVTPVLHYCMGGIRIDAEGNVLQQQNDDYQPIPGLHAVGEVSGGVHGHNRLGGNSLLECVVFGRIVGEKIPIS